MANEAQIMARMSRADFALIQQAAQLQRLSLSAYGRIAMIERARRDLEEAEAKQPVMLGEKKRRRG